MDLVPQACLLACDYSHVCIEMIVESEMKIENVNWFEIGKYLSVMMSAEEVQEEVLRNVIPKRMG